MKKKKLEEEYYKTKQKYELIVKKSMSPKKRRQDSSVEPVRTENSEIVQVSKSKRERVSISNFSNAHSAEGELKS